MTRKQEYKVRMVGGAAVVAMPVVNAGQKYTRTEGTDGVFYFRPVKTMEEAV